MGFTGSSKTPCQFKSVLLRTDEEFVRLYSALEEARRLFFQRSSVLDDDQGFRLASFKPRRRRFVDDEWQCVLENIRNVDHLMKRAEKCAQFSELLAGIMLRFKQNFFPNLESLRSGFETDGRWFVFACFTWYDIVLGDFLEVLAESASSGLESANKVVVSALALLSFVYHYLLGCVDKGGSKTYSPGSFLFRLIFVAIVLFLGSYVWIKSRQASFTANRRKRKLGDESDVPGGVYRRAVKDPRGLVTHYKYEPRFKPLREKSESGPSLSFNCLSLGSYNTRREAEIVYHIAVVLYGEEEGRFVQFEDGLPLPFPSVTEPEKCPPCGREKAAWVAHKTKELYAELLREKARRLQLLHAAVETGSHHGHAGEARRSDPSPSAPGAPSTAMELTCPTSPHGGNGLVEQPTTSECHGLGQEAVLAREVFSAFFPEYDFDQFPQFDEKDFPTIDDPHKVVGDNSERDWMLDVESSTLVPPQPSALDNSTCANVASVPQLGVGDQGLGIIEPHLNLAAAITSQQLGSPPEQVQLQQRVTYLEQCLEEFAGSNVELQQQLLESEQKRRKAEVENEEWRSMFRPWKPMIRQLAKLISASDEDGSPVDIQ